jgi:mannosyl-oligosaccharide glucosidase
VGLFPLLMRLLPPESPELGRLLRHLRDEDQLWTPFGLRCAFLWPVLLAL